MGFWTNQNKLHALNVLLGAGLSPFGAAGLVSRWANVESSANGPTAVNPSSGAFGIAQWLGSRLSPIRGNTNFDAQLAYVIGELNGSESRAGNVLRNALSPDDGARGASMYERAEGYNPATGRDNWTAITAAGIPAVYALLGSPGPAQQQQSSPIATSTSSTDSNGGTYVDSAADTPGNQNTKLLAALAIGGSLLWLYTRS